MITLTNSKTSAPFIYAAIASILSFSLISMLDFFNFNNLIIHKILEIGILMAATFLLMNSFKEGGKVRPFKGFFTALALGTTYAVGLASLYILSYYAFDINLISKLFSTASSNPLSMFIITGFELFAYAFIIALLSLQYYKKPANEN